VLSELRAQQTQDQLNEILVEIQQFSRDTLARMDTKIRMMHQMLAECERLTGRLEKAVEEAKELLQKLEESRTGGVVSGAAAPTVKMPSPEQTHLSPALPSAEKPINPLHARVLELFDSGQGLRQISAETGLQVGEIELILGLHGRKPIR
jgi:TolA-binding protein